TQRRSYYLPTAAGAAGTVRAINLSRAHSTTRASQRYSLTCSRLERKRSTSTLASTDSTLVCWPSVLCMLPSGLGDKRKRRICTSDISARAQVALRHWLQQPNFKRASAQSFPVVDVPIWLVLPCRW